MLLLEGIFLIGRLGAQVPLEVTSGPGPGIVWLEMASVPAVQAQPRAVAQPKQAVYLWGKKI